MFVGFLSVSGGAEPQQIKLPQGQIYTNRPSRFQFPAFIDEFEREPSVTQYEPGGRHVGIGYNDILDGVSATVFVYPIFKGAPDNTLKGHFQSCKAEVLKRHHGAKKLAEDKVEVVSSGGRHSGEHARFTYAETFAGERQPVRSEVYLFRQGSFFVLFRISYSAKRVDAAEPAVRAFLEGVGWPKDG